MQTYVYRSQKFHPQELNYLVRGLRHNYEPKDSKHSYKLKILMQNMFIRAKNINVNLFELNINIHITFEILFINMCMSHGHIC
jgi:hypothetical protein